MVSLNNFPKNLKNRPLVTRILAFGDVLWHDEMREWSQAERVRLLGQLIIDDPEGRAMALPLGLLYLGTGFGLKV
jgi:hypothetical protein